MSLIFLHIKKVRGEIMNEKFGVKPNLVIKERLAVLSDRIFSILLREIDLIRALFRKKFTSNILFIFILAIGIYARVWEFRQLPPGQPPDGIARSLSERG